MKFDLNEERFIKELEKELSIDSVTGQYHELSDYLENQIKELGFEVSEEGKHYKITYYGDGRYQTTVSKTPGDNRTGKNSAQTMMNMAF